MLQELLKNIFEKHFEMTYGTPGEDTTGDMFFENIEDFIENIDGDKALILETLSNILMEASEKIDTFDNLERCFD